MEAIKKQVEALDCGHGDTTTGYGIDPQGKTRCYACSAEYECHRMHLTGRATLYLDESEVTDWPGKLRFKISHQQSGNHNMTGKRVDVWFNGPDGFQWHGVTYGADTQLCHCKRTKTKTVRT